MRKIITPDLGIELTQKCNLNCSHCFRGAARNRNISKEIIEKVFDEIKYIQTLDLSGGEVFLERLSRRECGDSLRLPKYEGRPAHWRQGCPNLC